MNPIEDRLSQDPATGASLIRHAGDGLTVTLRGAAGRQGGAWVRTNIGFAATRRAEIVRRAEENVAPADCDWHDVAMTRVDDDTFRVTLALAEVGVFAAKAFFLPRGERVPRWPAGHDLHIKVEPAAYRATGTLYTAFVRQYAAPEQGGNVAPGHADMVRTLDAAGYAVIPRSGTFRDLVRRLDFIVGALRCRILQLLPIHPVPTTYARMGRFGSPFAVLDFLDIDSSLAEFDRRATPLDQFRELVDAVHAREAKVFLDIPANHTGWASALQEHHPRWFKRGPDRSFVSPGAWGVTWEDLAELDYRHRELWSYMAEVFLYWCAQDVDGFRCDAGYMIPFAAWEYIVARVRQAYPDTVFLLEGLGGKLATTVRLLSRAGLNWAYSELFQNTDRNQIEAYLPGAIRTSSRQGLLIHFAETHDNNRLAARSRPYARLRTALTALCSQDGAFGFANGVEWYADEKIDVHGASSLGWGREPNQAAWIARLNAILESHPCFAPGTELRLVTRGGGNVVVLVRERPASGERLLVCANLDESNPVRAGWPDPAFPGDAAWDLLSDAAVPCAREGDRRTCRLAPAGIVCLTAAPDDRARLSAALARPAGEIPAVTRQRLRAKALDVRRCCGAAPVLPDDDLDGAVEQLRRDPRAFCAAAAGSGCPPVTRWQWDADLRREVIVPPGHLLLVTAPYRFRARLSDAGRVLRSERSLPGGDGHFALFEPFAPAAEARRRRLSVTVYEGGAARRAEAEVRFLTAIGQARARPVVRGRPLREPALLGLCTNGRGAMAQVRAAWGVVRSQYDGLLAANLDPRVPVNRRLLFTRCRAWVVCRGYSRALGATPWARFERRSDGSIHWRYDVHVGMGKTVGLDVTLRMTPERNAVTLHFRRVPGRNGSALEPDLPVSLILRPDVEDRDFHEKTKAYQGPETAWPAAVHARAGGFRFQPAPDRGLDVCVSPGVFVHEPEWTYMVEHPVEAERGLDAHSDLFSPGYFRTELRDGEAATLAADADGEAKAEAEAAAAADAGAPATLPLAAAARAAIADFIVKRDDGLTVIAGYPWFLDWGRDTLICLRGIIAAGRHDAAAGILKQFARFEQAGTLPNMIRGQDHSNRDTSDAPLWFFVACQELAARAGRGFLDEDVGGRSVRDVLFSIAAGYRSGTANGIRMDPDSGLIFSPSHFTWMDTNFPAGTPREGYPIEIQALWFAALSVLAELDPGGDWSALAARVADSVRRYFRFPGADPAAPGGLSDCLHAGPGRPAAAAVADDHVRPNQLLAITLGAVCDGESARGILAACETLLVPGAIRSLADRAVTVPLAVERDGVLLNDPTRPYRGCYSGDEDTRRKVAYHNGTAWTWLFPAYAEALWRVYGDEAAPAALALLGSAADLLNRSAVGHLPEIVDGDTPHAQKGCPAQAWGATELYRVLALLGAPE